VRRQLGHHRDLQRHFVRARSQPDLPLRS
jgi:hypothetical protein